MTHIVGAIVTHPVPGDRARGNALHLALTYRWRHFDAPPCQAIALAMVRRAAAAKDPIRVQVRVM